MRLKAGVSTRAPGHRHRCLEPSTGPGALAGRGLCGPGRGERGGLDVPTATSSGNHPSICTKKVF